MRSTNHMRRRLGFFTSPVENNSFAADISRKCRRANDATAPSAVDNTITASCAGLTRHKATMSCLCTSARRAPNPARGRDGEALGCQVSATPLDSSTGDVAPAEVISSIGIRVKADLAQLVAKFFALVVLIKLEEGIEGGRWHAINRLCEPMQDCGRFQIPLVVRMFDGFLSAPEGLPLEYLNESYAPLTWGKADFLSISKPNFRIVIASMGCYAARKFMECTAPAAA